MPTLADSLLEASRATPHRVVLVYRDVRLTCESLHTQARALAEALEAEQRYDPDRALDRVAWLYKVPQRHVQSAARFEQWLKAA